MYSTRRWMQSLCAATFALFPVGAATGQDAAQTLATWITEAIPRDYEKREDWGRTRRVAVGLDVGSRGLRLRKKQVPHGVWKHYRIRLGDEPESPLVRVESLEAVAPGRVRAAIHLSAPIEAWLRTRLYEHGVHLGTYTLEGRSRIDLDLDCEIGVRLEGNDGLPAVAVDPIVHRAQVNLRDFELTRISSADGPLVHELGKAVRHVLEDELAPHKLTAKLNRAIAKKEDKLRWDLGDLANLPQNLPSESAE